MCKYAPINSEIQIGDTVVVQLGNPSDLRGASVLRSKVAKISHSLLDHRPIVYFPIGGGHYGRTDSVYANTDILYCTDGASVASDSTMLGNKVVETQAELGEDYSEYISRGIRDSAILEKWVSDNLKG